MAEEEKPRWVIEYDSDAEVIEIYLLNDNSIELKTEIPLDQSDIETPEDFQGDWEVLLRAQHPEKWAMAERIAAMFETGFYKPLDPKSFKVTELMDGEYQIRSDRGHEFILALAYPDGSNGDEDNPDHVELDISVNSVSLGLAPLKNGRRRPLTGNLDTFLDLLRMRLKSNLIAQDIELLEFLAKLDGFSYHIVPCEEGWWVTVWLPMQVFKDNFGHLDLEL